MHAARNYTVERSSEWEEKSMHYKVDRNAELDMPQSVPLDVQEVLEQAIGWT